MLYWLVFSPVLVAAVGIVAAWLYGSVFLRGYREGIARGTAEADAKWALWSEHGAL